MRCVRWSTDTFSANQAYMAGVSEILARTEFKFRVAEDLRLGTSRAVQPYRLLADTGPDPTAGASPLTKL
jgi:hypothetical protein